MREEAPGVSGTIKLSNRLDIRAACNEVAALLKGMDFPEIDVFSIRLSLEESVTNAVIHGNKDDPEKRVVIEYAIYPDRADLSVTDEGNGFDYDQVEDCTAPDNIMRPGGRGVCLIHRFMDEISYNETGNCVQMVRYRRSEEGK